MKRTALAIAGLACLPLAVSSVAVGQMSPDVIDPGVASTAPAVVVPNANRAVVVQAGATRRVVLGKVNAGTGYAWRWITKPKGTVAKGLAVRTTKATKPGGPTTASVRIIGLAEDQKTTGQLGLFAPSDQTTPTRTITLKITVTGDGR